MSLTSIHLSVQSKYIRTNLRRHPGVTCPIVRDAESGDASAPLHMHTYPFEALRCYSRARITIGMTTKYCLMSDQRCKMPAVVETIWLSDGHLSKGFKYLSVITLHPPASYDYREAKDTL
ncbi:uncharacterized protein MCYG_01155 [Microsporum canis CBS 113480]|uniref:Uncharacterized protein n=1 Tax=Arthroderma otae (strain ATCC MYA-4605 / CBS 113480) TaxID=554155 RepID=C5FEX3_ARTOC|nr:uncharacterized protein MCYG_01155 [Microsporum canis CBS 113480]EEQ28267.1 predicted protein [Microsporum canis CBS 113480]